MKNHLNNSKRILYKRTFLLIFLLGIILISIALIWNSQTCQIEDSPISHTIDEFEDIVYKNPFDVEWQVRLARSYWGKFEKSMKTDEYAGSQCMTAYMIACKESGDKYCIYKEFEKRFLIMAEVASLPNRSFSDYYLSMKNLMEATRMRTHVEQIIKLRDDFESVWKQMSIENQKRPDIIAAQNATNTYLRNIYDVEIGKKSLESPSGKGILRFATGAYDKLGKGLCSYGLILLIDFKTKKSVLIPNGIQSSPLNTCSKQIRSGESVGRFRLTNGYEIVPGLLYFKNPGPFPIESPSDVYRRMIECVKKQHWADFYDIFEEHTRDKMLREIRDGLKSMSVSGLDHNKIESLKDQELFSITCENSNPIKDFESEIISEKVDLDKAVVYIRQNINAHKEETEVHFVRVNGFWRLTL